VRAASLSGAGAGLAGLAGGAGGLHGGGATASAAADPGADYSFATLGTAAARLSGAGGATPGSTLRKPAGGATPAAGAGGALMGGWGASLQGAGGALAAGLNSLNPLGNYVGRFM
jgi:hypothetical protein